ncbi:MAG: tRNA (adenosine(37)-N6)-dimethylallyltransferase MiaA [Candidatus Magasanikbacteria bacterium]|nr:tRNA (adenosine(37)-N6)-dimethylallyltransferase MiaA [Candidatus Magasanikbacteria bacterium]
MTSSLLPKIIVILGPTASGKTELALRLAKEFSAKGGPASGWNGVEIISADSRQVYKYLNIGSAKPSGKWEKLPDSDGQDSNQDNANQVYMVDGVPHYLMDILDPAESFSVADFKRLALEKIADIQRRGKIPFIVGGTGLYIQALVENWDIAGVLPNKELRDELEAKSLSELIKQLGVADKQSLKIVDLKNKRRVIRALEVALGGGGAAARRGKRTKNKLFDYLMVGINWPLTTLRERIQARLAEQLARGFTLETKSLIRAGYSLDLPSLSSLGYKEIVRYLAGEMTDLEAEEKIATNIWRYAKRQNTWFRQMPGINWIKGADYDESTRLIQQFLR